MINCRPEQEPHSLTMVIYISCARRLPRLNPNDFPSSPGVGGPLGIDEDQPFSSAQLAGREPMPPLLRPVCRLGTTSGSSLVLYRESVYLGFPSGPMRLVFDGAKAESAGEATEDRLLVVVISVAMAPGVVSSPLGK